MTEERQGLPILPFASQAEWESWLEANGPSSKGLWAKISKKGSPTTTIQYQELLDGALCFVVASDIGMYRSRFGTSFADFLFYFS